MIIVVAQRFQRAVGIEHAVATGTQHIPGEIEQSEPRCMEEAGNRPLLVEANTLGKIQNIDPVELVVLTGLDQPRDGIGHRWIGRLLQHGELGLDIAHTVALHETVEASTQGAELAWFGLNRNLGSGTRTHKSRLFGAAGSRSATLPITTKFCS